MNKSIEISGISHAYGEVQALSDVHLTVDKGELMGLIGPDGAGKSTLYKILTTLVVPEKGSAKLCGLDVFKDYRELRKRIGYMPGKFSLYQDLTVEENLEFFATIFGTTIRENYHLIEEIYVQLEPFKNRPAGKLSGGMKQKLALCCALIHKPEVLLLDEPTTGVDPVSRKEFWQMLKRLNSEDITILVSTPYMDEAAMCDRVALIQKGTLLVTDRPEAINQQYQGTLLTISGDNTYELLKASRDLAGVDSCYSFGDSIHLTIDPSITSVESIRTLLDQKGFRSLKIDVSAAGIEDVFMQQLHKAS